MAIYTLPTGYGGKRNPEQATYRTMTRVEVLSLRAGQRVWFKANDGTARELKINGKVRTWKRDEQRVEVPIKYGLYEYGCLSLWEAMERLLVKLETPSELACGRCGADMALDPFHGCKEGE